MINQRWWARKIINHGVMGEDRESWTLGKTYYLDLAKARSRSNRSSLGFNFPYPHHDPVKDSLYLHVDLSQYTVNLNYVLIYIESLLLVVFHISNLSRQSDENVKMPQNTIVGYSEKFYQCCFFFKWGKGILHLRKKGIWNRSTTNICIHAAESNSEISQKMYDYTTVNDWLRKVS